MAAAAPEADRLSQFLSDADGILREASFVADSLPNVEPFEAERSLRKLSSVRDILLRINDPWVSSSDFEPLLERIAKVIAQLDAFQHQPEPPRNTGTHFVSGSRGAPRYALDLSVALQLHNAGNSWEDVAAALGVTRKTIYNHLSYAGVSSARPKHTAIDDAALDELVAEISLQHPFSGAKIILGHLEARSIHVPIEAVKASLRRVDYIGAITRWHQAIKRRVYKVRGANALWHHDGNEKLRPWGFYVHGCVDGHSRLIIYLFCCDNKRSSTVEDVFMREGVGVYGWPSRVRGDYGKENNGVERRMKARWGMRHMAYFRGRSTQNIRMERGWRDIRKDALEFFRQLFQYLEENELLDMENAIERVCLFLVFQPRIQAALDRVRAAWNLHKIRTARNRTPTALYELSRVKAIRLGYWTGDPGDDFETAADPEYGLDGQAPLPPTDELEADPATADYEEFPSQDAERDAGVFVNNAEEIAQMREALQDFDFAEEDGQGGISVYCRAVVLATAYFSEA
ncbi:Integrase catalytic domain-containing protein [Mycena kentingensis (nom. inval.)]|nr:Integrase catalytic domain-containing protein [Mycena kentingensis (nom. inval.)]